MTTTIKSSPIPGSTVAIALVAMVFVVVNTFVSVQTGKDMQLNNMRRTYTVCQTSPKSDLCQQQQVSTNTEYVCFDKPTVHCWVEVK